MQTQGLAPVVIPVYKRLEHLKICINSLLRNELAAETELYIFSDYAFSEKDQAAIDDIRAYLKSLSGFKRIVIKEQTENKGLENIQEAITLSLNLHPSIIYMEEDLEVSQNFLRFMNDQLMNYRDDSQVFSVAGYSLPCFDERGNKILASESFTAWGCGLWKNKMDFMNNFYIQIPLHNRLKNKLVAIKYICQHGIELYIHYLKYSNLKKLTPDLKIGFYLWSESKVQIFPADSLVRIHGHDGSGWHCEASEKFSTNKDINESLLPVHQKIENKNEIRNNYKKIRKFHNIGIEKDLIKFIKNPFFYIKKLII